jgi:hypothetical protein
MSGALMLLSYAGRKTGKRYTIPVGYFPWAPGEVMSFSSARWRANLRNGVAVTLLLKGRQVQAVPTVIEARDAVIVTLEEFIERLGLHAARRLPVGLPHDRVPTHQDLLAVPQSIAFIHFQIISPP